MYLLLLNFILYYVYYICLKYVEFNLFNKGDGENIFKRVWYFKISFIKWFIVFGIEEFWEMYDLKKKI